MFEDSVSTRREGEKQAYPQNIQAMPAEQNAVLGHITRQVQETKGSSRIHPDDQLSKSPCSLRTFGAKNE